MGSAMRVFRLVRAAGGAGCEHHVLLRAGRPSYPNADQGAEDAADDLPEVLMDALLGWWERWVLPARCRGTRHDVSVVADDVEVVGSGPPDLHADAGMRPVDVWVAPRPGRRGVVVGAAPDATTFRAEALEDTDEAPGEPVRLRVLLLTESSGDGDLRDP